MNVADPLCTRHWRGQLFLFLSGGQAHDLDGLVNHVGWRLPLRGPRGNRRSVVLFSAEILIWRAEGGIASLPGPATLGSEWRL